MTVLAFFAFLSGIITILSPCILPVLPIVLSGSVGGKSRPWGIISGFVLSFSFFTLALSALVQLLNFSPNALRWAALVILMGFGLVLAIPWLQLRFEQLVARLNRQSGEKKKRVGYGGGLLIGITLGLVWTPCVGPIMASVISLAVTRSVDGGALLIVISYTLGTSIPMVALMLGGRKLLARFPGLTKKTQEIQRLFGVLLILVGLAIGFNLDRQFQSWMLEVFPNYGAGLTAIEENEAVRRALEGRRETSDEVNLLPGQQTPPSRARLEDYGPAPSLVLQEQWINPTALPPGVYHDQMVTMEELEGYVVLVDFWTYSCVNCIRTLPYLRAWDETYREDGLVILGIHSPEFAFEKEMRNLEKAVEDLEVSWPVVPDNQFLQWQAYGNRYWPAKYLIDREGHLRYFHFGEGNYEETEELIRKLLMERGRRPDSRAEIPQEERNQGRTPETYLGYRRMELFQSPEEILKDQRQSYTIPAELNENSWALEGEWTLTGEAAVSTLDGALELRFHAGEVNLVIEGEEGARIHATLNGEIPADTEDMQQGVIELRESRLYRILKLEEAVEGLLRLETEGYIRLYAFTFG